LGERKGSGYLDGYAMDPHHYSRSQGLILPMGSHIIGTSAAGDRPDPS